jgi:hypothetical protein
MGGIDAFASKARPTSTTSQCFISVEPFFIGREQET